MQMRIFNKFLKMNEVDRSTSRQSGDNGTEYKCVRILIGQQMN